MLQTGCSQPASAGEAAGRRTILFFDQSDSIAPDQRHQWQSDAAEAIAALRDGWSLTIYGIHDHTLDAAPLFETDIPRFPSDGTSATLAKRNGAIQCARKGASDAVQEALSRGGASRTDIFSAVDRVHPDSQGRATTIVFFSDMLNSTPELNMERAGSVTLDKTPAIISKLARRHLWRKDTLSGCTVYCVLNSVAIGGRGPQVDRRVQRVFYENLFEALGANLYRYDAGLGGLYASR